MSLATPTQAREDTPVTPPPDPVAPASETTAPAAPLARPLLRTPPAWHKVAEAGIRILAFGAIAAVVLVFVFVGREALPLLTSDRIHRDVTVEKMIFAQTWPGYDAPAHVWQPVSDTPKFSVLPLVLGTLKVTAIAMLIALPLSIATALFVSQFAPPRIREVVKPAVELLSGIPSVVLGFFALIVLATAFQTAFGFEMRLNAVVAGAALALAVIPLVFTIAEEALRAVPDSYVEASLALGARRWQTILFVSVPAAAPGLFAAAALGLGRAVGETMIVLMASGNAAIVSWSFGESVRTVPATIAAELAEVVFGDAHYSVLFALGAALFVVTAAVNWGGDRMIARLRERTGTA